MTRYGIDLGTSKCCIAVAGPDGKAQVLPTRRGERLMPAVVLYGAHEEGQPVTIAAVGQNARRQGLVQPWLCVSGVRRLFGRRADDPDVRRLGPLLGGGVVAASNGDAWIDLGGPISPPDVAAALLRELRASAEEHLRASGPVEAVLTVPAGIGHAARQALKDACELAGIPVARLMSDAAAAAIGHGATRRAKARLAVCDLGAGRFDASIVSIEAGVVEIEATAGDNVGGEDFDRRIASRLLPEVRATTGYDLEADAPAYARFLDEVQRTKHAAVDLGHGVIEIPGGPGRESPSRTIKRLELEGWTRDLVDRLEAPCRDVLAAARVKPGEVREVLVAGGGSRLPSVIRKIEHIFGCPATRAQAPEEVVAVGAATYAAALDGLPEGMLVLDVVAHTVGFRAGGRTSAVVPRGTPVPARGERVLATMRDGQKEIAVDLVEGDNRPLGRYIISGLAEGKAGEVLVVCDFTVDSDGTCSVSARAFGGGPRPQVKREASSGLPRAELRRGHA